MKKLSKFLVLVFLSSLYSQLREAAHSGHRRRKSGHRGGHKEGATVYAADELKKLNDDLQAAMDEVSTQGKNLKKFGTAKEMLTKVQADADALKATIPAKIEAAKNAAIQAQTEAKAALDEAKALLEKAPMGKGTKADIMAMKADLGGLETSFAEVQTAIDGADYFGASAKAATIKEKATVISDQVKAAIEKVTGKR